jgi:hypothetical protein
MHADATRVIDAIDLLNDILHRDANAPRALFEVRRLLIASIAEGLGSDPRAAEDAEADEVVYLGASPADISAVLELERRAAQIADATLCRRLGIEDDGEID